MHYVLPIVSYAQHVQYTTCYLLCTTYYVLRAAYYMLNTKYCYFYYFYYYVPPLLLVLLLLLWLPLSGKKACLMYHFPLKKYHAESAFTKKIAKSLAIVAIGYTALPPVLAVLDWVVGTNNEVGTSHTNDNISLKHCYFEWQVYQLLRKNRLLTPLVRVWYYINT